MLLVCQDTNHFHFLTECQNTVPVTVARAERVGLRRDATASYQATGLSSRQASATETTLLSLYLHQSVADRALLDMGLSPAYFLGKAATNEENRLYMIDLRILEECMYAVHDDCRLASQIPSQVPRTVEPTSGFPLRMLLNQSLWQNIMAIGIHFGRPFRRQNATY
ncbi:hypothetical protein BJ508DRAFT_418429 [Ascobolus immersus RN42]|uniref:Uncharacterized protein n=1 Tax=Ascobolus immersus RN42 TaxID=1160509 RepID=A0A3N4HM02_ASCIM|nr:hypothetical protein BJ508DRAFT_418429 [Ascobolus immersus RN42]